jgi:membrane protease subunit HflK
MMPEDAGSQALSDALRSSFAIVRIIMVILVIVFFASGVFTVPSQEKAIVLRFGKPVGTGEGQLLGPGLHWSFPYPIDEVVRIPISQIQTVRSTTGWYATTPEAELAGTEPEPLPSLNPALDGYTLTKDGNIVHARMTLRYRINAPLNYTLDFVNASNLVQNALNSALIHASAQFTVDEALVSDVAAFRERTVARVRELVEQQGLGISIEEALLESIPPRYVRTAFANVIAADQDRGRTVTEAQAYASRARNTASGDARRILNEGKTEADRLLQSVAADAEYFEDQLPHYRSNPELFLARLQTESLRRILTNANEKILRLDSGQRSMWLQVNREPVKPASPPQQQSQQSQASPGR